VPSSTRVYHPIFLNGHHIDLRKNRSNDVFSFNQVDLTFRRIVVSLSISALRCMVARFATHKTISFFLKIVGFGFEHIGIITIGLIIVCIKFMLISFFM